MFVPVGCESLHLNLSLFSLHVHLCDIFSSSVLSSTITFELSHVAKVQCFRIIRKSVATSNELVYYLIILS